MTIRRRYLYKNFTNPQLSWNDFCKSMIAILLLTLFLSCGKSKNKIEGTWTYIREIEKGKEINSSEQVENFRIQYLDNGEMKLFSGNKRFGIGLYYYKLKVDSLYSTNIQVDTMGRIDTLGTFTSLVSIKNDIMIVKHGAKTIYYKREKD